MTDSGFLGVQCLDWEDGRRRMVGDVSPLFLLGAEGTTRPCWVQSRMEHGQTSPPHAHSGWTCTVVIGGSWRVGGQEMSKGQMVLVEPDVEYGPFEPGPDGVEIVEIFADEAAVEPIWGEHAQDPRVLALNERLANAASE
jgi:hypothetical protein